MNLGEMLPISVLKGMSSHGSVLQAVCAQWVGGLDLMRTPVMSFLQFLQAAVTVGCGWGRGASPCAGCEAGLPLCLPAITTLQGWSLSPVVGAEALSVRLELALFPLSLGFPFLHTRTFAPGEGSAEASAPRPPQTEVQCTSCVGVWSSIHMQPRV